MNEKEICKSLVEILDAYEGGVSLVSNQGQAMDGYSALANFISVAEKARHLTRHSNGRAKTCDCKDGWFDFKNVCINCGGVKPPAA